MLSVIVVIEIDSALFIGPSKIEPDFDRPPDEDGGDNGSISLGGELTLSLKKLFNFFIA